MMQRALLCGHDADIKFFIVRANDFLEMEEVIERALKTADIIVMPFEACPEWVPVLVRSHIERVFRSYRDGGGMVISASGNIGTIRCAKNTPRRFPADLPSVTAVGAGIPSAATYTLRWRDRPQYFVNSGVETPLTAGTSFAAARFALWYAGKSREKIQLNLLRR